MLNGYQLKKSPWKIHCFYNMFLEKRKMFKEQKKVEDLLRQRVQLRNKIIDFKLNLDLDFMEKTMQKYVKRQHFELAAELRERILLIQNGAVYGNVHISNNTR